MYEILYYGRNVIWEHSESWGIGVFTCNFLAVTCSMGVLLVELSQRLPSSDEILVRTPKSKAFRYKIHSNFHRLLSKPTIAYY
ncbi:hypothetical protein T11_6019 [Trichinella zimbabwensis]|uniref:Uncharacterized protein n=1 Tax=Trichinella zimbabwensis TaxID=268475 RepID=A0A0V1HKB0_9BILA|nr:hypothetical protein T11_6019 [Trichinella zimbabwensis]